MIQVFVPHWDGWGSMGFIYKRKPNTLFFENDIYHNMFLDIEKFFKSKQWYIDRGIPWKRVYMLHGPPGNGKTSLIKTICSNLNKSINIINLSSTGLTEDKFTNLMLDADLNNIMVFEDMDTAFAKRESKNKLNGVSFTEFINQLDGLSTRDGRVVIMTTNHFDKLDPAIKRPGRIDKVYFLDNANKKQIYQLVNAFYENEVLNENDIPDNLDKKYSVSYFQELCLNTEENDIKNKIQEIK